MSGPIRELHDVEGRLFAVSGTTLYEISNAGVAIPLGSIPGVGRVSMAHNQVAGGHQLTVVNGTGGYVWNTATQSFQIITDEGFPGSSRVDFIDGYMMHVEPFGRFLLHSDLADALNFNTLDRFEAETQPDRTRSLIVNNQEVWAFGDRTIDVFANAGTAQGTFQNKGVSISVGCIAGASPAIIDNGVAWLGHDRVVYHARGYSPTRISTRAIDVALSECSLADIRGAFSLVFEDRGHAIYYLTIPNGPTFGYDFSTGLWHRRASWHPERDIDGRWCLSALVRSNGQWIGGDYRTGKLYRLDWDYMLEGCEPLIRKRTSPVAHNNGNRFTIDEIELQFETGGPETVCEPFPYQPVGPQISGEAPDGLQGDAYSFTYTTVQGTAPITRTVLIDTTLPAGWEWDEQTATISNDNTPIAIGVITLKMRVYDQNGLYADHEDQFVIAEEYFLLVTGNGASTPEQPFFSSSTALEPLNFTGLSEASGADMPGGIPHYYEGTWVVAGFHDSRVSTDNLASFDTVAISRDQEGYLTAGHEGWMLVGPGDVDVFDRTGISTDPISGFTPYAFSVFSSPGTNFPHGEECYMARYSDGIYWLDVGNQGAITKVTDFSLPEQNDSFYRPNNIWSFSDVWVWGDAVYATCFIGTFPATNQLRRSHDGGETWPDVLYEATGTNPTVWQIEENGEHLIVLTTDCGHVLTSADNFATLHETGVLTDTAGGTIRGRMMVAAGGRVHIISGAPQFGQEDKGGRCVSTIDGLTFSTPVEHHVPNATGIAAGRLVEDE